MDQTFPPAFFFGAFGMAHMVLNGLARLHWQLICLGRPLSPDSDETMIPLVFGGVPPGIP